MDTPVACFRLALLEGGGYLYPCPRVGGERLSTSGGKAPSLMAQTRERKTRLTTALAYSLSTWEKAALNHPFSDGQPRSSDIVTQLASGRPGNNQFQAILSPRTSRAVSFAESLCCDQTLCRTRAGSMQQYQWMKQRNTLKARGLRFLFIITSEDQDRIGLSEPFSWFSH